MKMRKEKGVTLIVLVVTIVVIIILAGVSMQTAFGKNGIVEQSKKQKEEIQKKQETSENVINNLEQQLK